MLTPEEARNHPLIRVLDRAIGNRPEVEVDIGPSLSLVEGDTILLCSDGLCGYADESEMEAVLRISHTAGEAANRLIGLALEKGGDDNVTVQFIQYAKPSGVRRKSKPVLYGLIAAIVATALLAGLLTTDTRQKTIIEKTVVGPDNTPSRALSPVTSPDRSGAEPGQKAPQEEQNTEKSLQNPDTCSKDKDQPCNPAVNQNPAEETDPADQEAEDAAWQLMIK